VIRNVVLVKLTGAADRAAIAAIQDGFRQLDCPGTVSYTLGDDLALREGNWSFAIVADFEDEAAYRAYDADVEHNRLRALLAPHTEQIARVQFALPDA
jgi:Stress responsive A/B Barrel Domain